MSEPIELAPSSTPITEEIGSVGWWVNKEALPLLRALRESVNGLILEPFVLRETGGPTDLTLGAIADGEVLKRVGTEVVGVPGVSTDGSVFSMTGPTGAADPVVVYDFTNFYDQAATDAVNVTAANRSGNSDFNLSIIGTPTTRFLSRTGAVGQMPFGFQPMSMGSAGGALFSAGVANYLETTIAAPALQFLGAMTMEWFGYVSVAPSAGTGDIQFVNMEGPASLETEAENVLYLLQWRDTDNNLLYFHENAGGLNSEAVFFTTPETIFTPTLALPIHLCVTRASSGSVTLYANGRRTREPVTPGPNAALPTGGTSAKLRISQVINTGAVLATLGVRLFASDLTAAQALESHRRTVYGQA